MKHTIKNWKIALVGILGIVVAVAIGCQDQVTEKREHALDESNLPKDVATQLNRLRLMSPKSNFQVLQFKSGDEMDLYQKMHPSVYVAYSMVGKNNYSIIEPNGFFESLPKNESEVFSIVDEVATPVLGINGFYEQLSYAIQYPENARKKRIEGKVYIEFIVQTDGSVTDARIIRGIDDEIDTEALRAFYQLSDKWYPAIRDKQLVKLKMVLPIVFSLSSQNSLKEETVDNSFPWIEPSFGYENSLNPNKKLLIEGLVQGNQGILPGAKIQVKNTPEGAYSAADGKFFLETSETSGTLIFSFPGFKTTEIQFGK